MERGRLEDSRDPTPHSTEGCVILEVLAFLEKKKSTHRSGHPELTCWVTRVPTWMGGGVGTEEFFACQALGLALNTW